MKLDLHFHSTASDGGWSPTRVADEAERRALRAWALTDHDTIAGWAEVYPRPGLICGTEISTWTGDLEVHVVALGFDPDDAAIAALLESNVAIRRQRAQVILDHVRERTGVAITIDECLVDGAGMITRSHIAGAMVRRGLVGYHQQAFDDHIGDRVVRELYQPGYPSPAEAAAVARAAGGVAILAHPAMYGDINLIERLMTGLDGIEVKHPSIQEPLHRLLVARAEAKGWLLSAGSDFHREPCRLGDWRLSRALAAPLLRAVGWRDPVTGNPA